MVVGPRAKPTPAGLEHAAELARIARNAQHALNLEVGRLLERPDAADIACWAESLTGTNCDWRFYEVGQHIKRNYPYHARPAPSHDH